MLWARRLYTLHAQSDSTGIPVDELRGMQADARAHERASSTRREFLAAGAGIAAGAAMASHPAISLAASLGKPTAPRIAIVGAGLAGLRCAHLLWTQSPGEPIASTIYEANPERAGGRCWTLRDYFQDGLETEHGGSFLNTDQHAVRGLAALLGLKEEVVHGGDLLQGEEVFFIDGAQYDPTEASADWANVGYPAFQQAAREEATPEGEARLDSLSVPEWLESTPIGANSRFGKLMQANTVTENGGDPSEQSALDLIQLLSGNKQTQLVPLPGADARFHIAGGNDQLVTGMIAQLPEGAVQHGHALTAVRENSDQSITLAFEVSGATTEATFDLVVFALPFSTLRHVDLKRSGLSPTKKHVIKTMGMGSNAKVHLQLTHKTWPALGFSGAIYGEWDRLACAWDDCVQLGPDASPALYVAFPGGKVGRNGLTGEAHGPAPTADAAWALREIEHLFPGTTAAYSGLAYEDHWHLDPWVQGAYSYYRVGQAATYGQLNKARDGRFYYAGEHCAITNIGFLDGAVETGEHAARSIIGRVG